MGQVRLAESLARAKQTARLTFEVADPIFSDVEKSLTRFDGALGVAADRYALMHHERDKELKNALAPLVLDKRNQIQARFKALQEAHAVRRRELGAFTVMFFGATGAGKSTTIEALTAGDGGTIGPGSPDFTKDVHGVPWDGLTLVDTPGLLGFREELYGVAEAYVDRADVICMVVMDDSIAPVLFERMCEVRGQNKHLVVLLNVKAANNPILRHEPEDAFDEKEVSEHVEFIRQRLREVFPGDAAPVIPFCANAAFEAQHADGEEERQYLWQASRIDAVIAHLVQTVEKHGIPIRATAAFDSLSHYSQSIAQDLETDLPALKGQLAELQRKRSEAQKLFHRVMRDSASDLARLKDHFRGVHEALDELAWEFARGDRRESVKTAFRRTCRWEEVEAFSAKFRSGVIERVQRNLEQFRGALGEDLVSAVALAEPPEEADIVDLGPDTEGGAWKRKAGKVTRVASPLVAAAAGFLIGGPVGFLAALLVGWGAKKIGDHLTDSGVEDQRGTQRELRDRLRDSLWEKYRRVNDDLFAWLEGLVDETQAAVIHMLEEYALAVGALTREGDSLARDLHRARHGLARLSFGALLRAVHPVFRDGRAVLVDAAQWMQYRAKILVQGRDGRPIAGLVIGKGGELIRIVREHTGNPIDVVEVDGEGLTPRMVAAALMPARIPVTAVEIGTDVRVTVSAREYGTVVGKRRLNLLLVEELLGRRVHVRATGQGGERR